jgi:hypothetical protein
MRFACGVGPRDGIAFIDRDVGGIVLQGLNGLIVGLSAGLNVEGQWPCLLRRNRVVVIAATATGQQQRGCAGDVYQVLHAGQRSASGV